MSFKDYYKRKRKVNMQHDRYKPQKNIATAMLILLLLPVCIIRADDVSLFNQGNTQLRQDEYKDALTSYDRFAKEHPQHRLRPAALWTAANIHMIMNQNYSVAAKLYENISQEYPETEWEMYAYERWGQCLEEQEMWQDAADLYNQAILAISDNGQTALAQVHTARYLQNLLSCYRSLNDQASIIALYQDNLAQDPTGASAPEHQYNLAQVYLEIDDTTAALENFVTVVERYPASPFAQRVQTEHTDLFSSEMDYDWTTFNTFQSALELSETGQYDEAAEMFDQVIDDLGKTEMAQAAHFQKQLIEFRKTGDAASFMNTLESTEDEYPYRYGGAPAAGLMRALETIIEARETINAYPDDVGAYNTIGFVYYQTRAYLSGIDIYKKALTIEPDNEILYNMLGYCYIGVQQYDDAIKTFQQLIEVAPEDPNSYDSMAEGYYSIGNIDKALEFYHQSLTVDSTFTNPYFMLGRIHQEQGNIETAIGYLEKYLELDPDGFQSRIAQALLEQLQPADQE
jgi:tetratricopeptide (TPR) repeat protein